MNHQTNFESWDTEFDNITGLLISSTVSSGSDIVSGELATLEVGEEEEPWEEDEFNETTIKGLVGNFSILSLASSSTSSSSSTSNTSATPTLQQYSQFSTIPNDSNTSQTTSVASVNLANPGTIVTLGSNRTNQQAVDAWDEDMDIDLPSSLSQQIKSEENKLTSHISSDNEDTSFEQLLPTPKTTRKSSSSRSFTSVRSEGEQEDGFDESDFDLPGNLKKINFAPLLSRSTLPIQQDPIATSFSSPSSALLLPNPFHHIPSPENSWGEEEVADDDESFFDELVIPSYFSGGPGALTPPSDGESFRGKIDLQGILHRKLELRSKEQESRNEKSLKNGSPLDAYRETSRDELEEDGLEIDEGIPLGSKGSLLRSGTILTSNTSQLTPTRNLSSANQARGNFGPGRSSFRSIPSSTLPKTPTLQPFSSPLITNLSRFASNVSNTPSTPVRRRIPPVPRIDTSHLSPRIVRPSSSSDNNNQQLQAKKSHGNLSVTASATRQGSLERKRSLQNVMNSSNAVDSVPHRPLTPGSSPSESPKVQHAPRTDRSTPSFSSSTFSSTGRVRERLHSGSMSSISSTTSSERPSSRNVNHSHHSSTSSISSRLSQPTLASQAKQRVPPSPSLSGIQIPLSPLQISKPKRARDYGNGMELDEFDDLVISKKRESRTVLPLSSSGTGRVRRVGSGTNSSISSLKSLSSGGSLSSVSGKKFVGVSNSNPADSGSRLTTNLEAGPPTKKRSSKKEPQLIKNLGHRVGVKSQGEMTWDPIHMKWHGNESALRDFDKVVSSSVRPALITNSPARFNHKSPSISTSYPPPFSENPMTTLNRANVKVVGSMIFDPAKMSWYSLASEGEDELDLAAEGGDDEGDGWDLGEQARMLKSRASFMMSEGSRDGESETVEGEGGLWNESVAAERRHEVEMRSWLVRGEVAREGLWDLRTLILSDTPPR